MKEFSDYIKTNKWLIDLMNGLSEEDAMRLEDAFYGFKNHCNKAEKLPISDVSDQRELLIKYESYRSKMHVMWDNDEDNVDEFLEQ